MKRISLFVLLSLTFFLYSKELSKMIETVDDGVINWTEGTVVVTGSGAPDLNIDNGNSARLFSEKVAKKNAGYRLQKILGGISVNGQETVSEFIKKRKDTALETPGSRVEPLKIVSKKDYSDGSVDLKLEYSIRESIHETCMVYLEELQKKKVSTKVVRNLPVGEEVLFSKLVVEVGKKKFKPVLFPRIVSVGKKLIYGLEKQVGADRCGKLMKYVNNYDKKDCLYIKARKIGKNGDIIISDEDELKVKTQLKDKALLNGNVLIVLK